MASYVIAAALFVVGSSYLLHFVIEPPGASTTALEHLELKSKADDALGILVGSPGVPSTWDASAADIDAVKRLGLVESGTTLRLDPAKFDALAKGKLETASSSNAGVDYAEAKAALGLSGYEFHLRAYPLIKPSNKDYGLAGFDDFRVGYVGAFTGTPAAPTDDAKKEIDHLKVLNIDFEYDSTHLTVDDVFSDDTKTIRAELLPYIGASVQQTAIASGSGLEHKFYRVPASTYTTLAPTAGASRALAISLDGATLGYVKNLEIRAIVGKADLTGATTATLTWKEWVDTDRGNLSYDCQDYGYVEVSPDDGQTWFALTNTQLDRSQDCSSTVPVITPHAATLKSRTAANLLTSCPLCAGKDEVLVAYHWTADNDNTIGYGWVVDDVKVLADTTTVMHKTFENAEYDMVIFGSGITNDALVAEDVKAAIRDYVDIHGGRIVVTGPTSSVNWLNRLFDAGTASASAGVSTPDTTHPLLTLPNQLDYNGYPAPPAVWDFTTGNGAGLFSGVMAESELKHRLSVSRKGAWGDGSTDEGAAILSSYQPFRMTDEEARKFYANAITYGKFHYLYIDFGPLVPSDEAVASATRTATMNMHRTGTASYTEMAFILYVWPGMSTAATASGVVVPASPPLGVKATTAPNTMTVSWTYPSSNGSAAPQEFVVYRGHSPDAITTQVGTVAYPNPWTPGTTFTFSQNTLTNGMTYYYHVRLRTAGGAEGTASDPVSGTPIGPPGAPSTNGAPVAEGLAGKIRVTWTQPTDTGGGTIYGYTVNASTDSGATWVSLGEIGAVTTFDHSVSDTIERIYRVDARNAYGWGPTSASSNAAKAIAPIDPPTLSVAAGDGPGNLTLTWVAPDVVGQTLQGYRILRAIESGGSFAQLAYLNDPTNVSFKDVGYPNTFGPNVTRFYKVQGVTEYGDGLLSTEKFAKTMGTPDTPTWIDIVRTPVTDLRTLTWNAVTTSDWPVVRYDVFRGQSQTDALIHIGASTTTSYVDSPGPGPFYYAVKAVSAAGLSDASERRGSIPTPTPAPTLGVVAGAGPNNLTLTWTAPATADPTVLITGYHVQYAIGSGGPYADLVTINDPTDLSHTDELGANNPNVTRYYRVKALTNDGDGLYSEGKFAKTMGAPDTPTGGTVIKNAITGVRTFTWLAPASDWPVARYDVYRADSSNGLLTKIGETNGGALTAYDDATAGNGSKWYTVVAVSAAGSSAMSARYQST